ncbi:MAG: hypothetical protein HY747_08595 [Elusimicrobia bacterium]|nr:hypothetical protein [Elusimicrobiota bacterium]
MLEFKNLPLPALEALKAIKAKLRFGLSRPEALSPDEGGKKRKIGFLEIVIFSGSLLVLGLIIWFISLTFFGSSKSSQAQLITVLSSPQKNADAAAGRLSAPEALRSGAVLEGRSETAPQKNVKTEILPAVVETTKANEAQKSPFPSLPQVSIPAPQKNADAATGRLSAPEALRSGAELEGRSAPKEKAEPWGRSETVTAPPRPGEEQESKPAEPQSIPPFFSKPPPPAQEEAAKATEVTKVNEATKATEAATVKADEALKADMAKEQPAGPQTSKLVNLPVPEDKPAVQERPVIHDQRPTTNDQRPVVVYQPRTKRDPTVSPAQERQSKLAEDRRREKEKLKHAAELTRQKASDPFESIRRKISVQGVLDTEEGILVIVNNQILKRGDSYLDAKIVRIQGNKVVFKYKGKLFEKSFNAEE